MYQVRICTRVAAPASAKGVVVCNQRRPSSEQHVACKVDRLLRLRSCHKTSVIQATTALCLQHVQGLADQALDYFAKLGFACPMHENPADHLMDIITRECS